MHSLLEKSLDKNKMTRIRKSFLVNRIIALKQEAERIKERYAEDMLRLKNEANLIYQEFESAMLPLTEEEKTHVQNLRK